jgi:hypothetical protein
VDAAEECIAAVSLQLQEMQRKLRAGRQAAHAWKLILQLQSNRSGGGTSGTTSTMHANARVTAAGGHSTCNTIAFSNLASRLLQLDGSRQHTAAKASKLTISTIRDSMHVHVPPVPYDQHHSVQAQLAVSPAVSASRVFHQLHASPTECEHSEGLDSSQQHDMGPIWAWPGWRTRIRAAPTRQQGRLLS